MLVHATGESLDGPHAPETYAVVLAARDELHITLIAERLEAAGVKLTRVREPDPPFDNALMALGVYPARKESLRRHLSDVPLLR
jgi:hypothetical protein